ncbi:MAG: hypothetical protein HY710_00805 [Candidatus Latescibacteria bacterium]|nr:hypothetical protein [Candidatus Latescibacterota bacterium]
MRLIAVGCEYTGKTTLLESLMTWGAERGIRFHLDDHFSIPDRQFLSPADKQVMLNLTPVLKERFQRFQVVYHVRLLDKYEHILLAGFHIEEAVYGPLYYYPGIAFPWNREFEKEMPDDVILLLLTARPDVIERRMTGTPHESPIVQKQDIEKVLRRFEEEFGASWIKHKIQVDTSDMTPDDLSRTFHQVVIPHLNTRDLLARMAHTMHGL